MEWSAIVVVVILLGAIVGVAWIARRGVNIDRRHRKPTRIRRAKGEYQPPEPPEGRYWG